MSHTSLIASLESLLVRSEKAVATAEEALGQAKTVLEEARLSLATVLLIEKSEQPKADSSFASGKKKNTRRRQRVAKDKVEEISSTEARETVCR